MRHPSFDLDQPTRRQVMSGLARGLLGVSLLPALVPLAGAEPRPAPSGKRVICLFMHGGMSHLDTFDPKPDNKAVQGPVEVIGTKVPGIRVTANLPRLAERMDRLALIRNMHHTMGNHEPGQYLLRTGHEHQAGIIHPSLGAWISQLGAGGTGALPKHIRVGDLGGHPGAGFFDVRHAPMPISKPEDGLANSHLPAGITTERFARRRALMQTLDADFQKRYGDRDLRAYSDFYDDAVRLMASSDLDAFDLSKEKQELRAAYGEQDRFGQGVLLARRLVERGVSYVEIDLGGWDSHIDNHKQVAASSATLDRALSALLDDLAARGLTDDVLVLVLTEFGRTPDIDQYFGRNHWPIAFTCAMAGGGIRTGQVIGQTDARGERVVGEATSVLDLYATVAKVLGLDTAKLFAPAVGGQKFSMVGKDTGTKGRPLSALFG